MKMTVEDIFNEVILEKKTETLTLFYDVNVLIQNYEDSVKQIEAEPEEEEVPDEMPSPEDIAADEPEEEEIPDEMPSPEDIAIADSFEEKGIYLKEGILREEVEGQIVVNKSDAKTIQTFQDLIVYLSTAPKQKKDIKSPIEKVLGKGEDKIGKEEEFGSKNIISEVVKEAIFVLIGLKQQDISSLIKEEDRVIIDIDYGHSKLDSIGFRINKNAGTDIFSTVIKKDGDVIPGKFDIEVINNQLIYYLNSIK